MAKHITFGGHSRAAILRGVNKLADTVKNSNIGYNVLTEKFEDLIAAGVIDPAKVTRSALQNASSIAGLMLTTEVLISELPASLQKLKKQDQ
jgi:chaperonin GroEL